MAQHNELGKKGESIASNYLQLHGYEILEKNWRFEHAEIDIIATKQDTIIFVEVKTRSTDYFGYPEESINHKKKQKLIFGANAYIQVNQVDKEIRFDIISIIINENENIHHIKDAIIPYDEDY